MKLHLGCGEKYLPGYINVDLPPSEDSGQIETVADAYANLLEYYHSPSSIQEVRLHHVFEHFARPTACALLASWHSWLQPNGTLHIEVPDFQSTASVILKRFAPRKKRAIAERHIFGSHEATWAVHYAGYTPKSLSSLVTAFGYKVNGIKKNSWHDTYNFELFATKRGDSDRSNARTAAEEQLKFSLVDTSTSEVQLLQRWLQQYDKCINHCWAR